MPVTPRHVRLTKKKEKMTPEAARRIAREIVRRAPPNDPEAGMLARLEALTQALEEAEKRLQVLPSKRR